MGPHARELFVIQHLEELVGAVKRRVKVEVGEVHVLDPGDGSALAAYAAAYPQIVASVLQAVGQTTGVDVPALLGRSRAADTATGGER
jgi:flotillin